MPIRSEVNSNNSDKVNEVIDEYPIKKKVLLNIRNIKFSQFDKIGFDKLDWNTKITCMGSS